MTTYYPEYERKKSVYAEKYPQVSFSTTIRKEKDGTWVDLSVVRTFTIGVRTEAEMLQEFHKYCYTHLICEVIGEIDSAEADPYGMGRIVFPKSELQISEKERLTINLS